MKTRLNIFGFVLLAAAFAAASTLGAPGGGGADCEVSAAEAFQQGPGRGPIGQPRDPELEKQSYHNLEVAKYYFYKRKPDKKDKDGWERLNKAVESRLTEIMDSNPSFARMDDVYFMLGELYKRAGDPDKAVDYWNKVLKEFPDSALKADAQKRLNETNTQNKEKKG